MLTKHPAGGDLFRRSKTKFAARSHVAATSVLVVTSDPHTARMVREALAFEDVHVSGRATEALELVRDRDFALVLCELSICPTTGIALFEQLVRLRPELADRFVLLTRARGLAGVPLSIGQHEIRMLCKPFGSRELDELLGRAQLALEA